jgi:hypothetical protein
LRLIAFRNQWVEVGSGKYSISSGFMPPMLDCHWHFNIVVSMLEGDLSDALRQVSQISDFRAEMDGRTSAHKSQGEIDIGPR